MCAKPTILPLDSHGRIYVLQDEEGNIIGTGTRQVCEVLLYIITKPLPPSVSVSTEKSVSQKPNVRSAITIASGQ
ncbi:MAG: hypothetical protein H0V18_15760 [Pyrinomonadaceae bacterium]|nr:hypothetical protein [Pyrinomonadaceae bacterium]